MKDMEEEDLISVNVGLGEGLLLEWEAVDYFSRLGVPHGEAKAMVSTQNRQS